MLDFFRDLLLFTGGLTVLIIWVLLVIAGSVEIYDFVTEKFKKEDD